MPSIEIATFTFTEDGDYDWDRENPGFPPVIRFDGIEVWRSLLLRLRREDAADAARDHLLEHLRELLQ